MRRSFFIFIIFSFSVHAQDTIHFRNGEVKSVKVSEVGISEVKYNRFDNVSGPIYVSNKNDIRFIKYRGGDIDSFPFVKTEIKQIEQPLQPQRSNSPNSIFACDKLVLEHNNKILCNGFALSESKLTYILMRLPEGQKKESIMKVHAEMKVYQKKQYQFGFGGLIVLVAAPTIGMVGTAFSEDVMPYLAGIVVGGVAAIAGAIISKEFKQKRMAKRYQIVKMYNDEFNFQK